MSSIFDQKLNPTLPHRSHYNDCYIDNFIRSITKLNTPYLRDIIYEWSLIKNIHKNWNLAKKVFSTSTSGRLWTMTCSFLSLSFFSTSHHILRWRHRPCLSKIGLISCNNFRQILIIWTLETKLQIHGWYSSRRDEVY